VRRFESHGVATAIRIVLEVKRHYYSLRYPRVRLGPGVSIKGRLKVKGGTRVDIGAGSRLGKQVLITGPGKVTVGSNTLLNGCWIGSAQDVRIGDRCLISDCDISDSDYHNLPPELRHEPAGPRVVSPIVIGDNVWIGAHAIVLKGVHIGTDSVVGAGTVVRSDVEPGTVVVGNPQQVVKRFAG
jgi:acetyltransferase-like isoleucine patch superfamily enzyme